MVDGAVKTGWGEFLEFFSVVCTVEPAPYRADSWIRFVAQGNTTKAGTAIAAVNAKYAE